MAFESQNSINLEQILNLDESELNQIIFSDSDSLDDAENEDPNVTNQFYQNVNRTFNQSTALSPIQEEVSSLILSSNLANLNKIVQSPVQGSPKKDFAVAGKNF